MKQILLFVFVLTTIISAQQLQPNAQVLNQNSDQSSFIENKGQWPDEVRWLTTVNGLNLWITDNGAVYDYYTYEKNYNEADIEALPDHEQDRIRSENTVIKGHVVNLEFLGMNTLATDSPQERIEGQYNYYIGNDESKWASGVHSYETVILEDVYDGIDIRYYYDEEGIRYDYQVDAGADISKIRFRLDGAESTSVNEDGELVVQTSLGDVVHGKLFAYQGAWYGVKPVEVGFTVEEDGVLSIDAAEYDRQKQLIIDPLLYATYLGGTNNDMIQELFVWDGRMVACGYTFSTDYPTTTGAYQTSLNGSSDIFITAFNTDGSDLYSSTYIGGNSNDDCYAAAMDASGNIYLTGNTFSTNFPGAASGYSGAISGISDGFVLKVTPYGASVTVATYLGGSNTDYLYDISLGVAGDVFVAGNTWSNNFPGAVNSYSTNLDAVVAKLNNSLTTLSGSRYLGGSSSEYSEEIVLDAYDNIYVVGYTSSSDFPTTTGAYDETYNDVFGNDLFVCLIPDDFSELTASTFLGGASAEVVGDITFDNSGNVVIVGETSSDDYPTTAGAYSTTRQGYDIIISVLNPILSSLDYSTFFGGPDDDEGNHLAIDSQGHIIFSGETQGAGYPTTNGAFSTTVQGFDDVSLTKLDITTNTILHSTLYGGNDWEGARQILFIDDNTVYVAGSSSSTDLPTTAGTYDATWNGVSDGMIIKMDLTSASVEVTAPNGGETWQSGTSQNITWTSTEVTTVDIEYSTDNGSSWVTTPIATGVTASLGTYSWTVPDLYSNQCLVRITDASDGTINDVSDDVFTIDNRSLEVTAPNGGENWKATTTQEITWTSSNITNVKIEYLNVSIDAPIWTEIVASTPSDGSYDWTLPSTPSNYRVRISDASDATFNDESDAAFTIFVPTLNLNTPNGGETLSALTATNITWTTTGITLLKIEYSIDDGISWGEITSSASATAGTYSWVTPNVYATECRIRISDAEATTFNDISNQTFTIDNRGVTVTSPNGGEVWESGTAKAITWTAEGVSNVKIEYSTNNGSGWSTIVNSLDASLGTFNWTVPNTPSDECLVKITDVSESTINDQSSGVFEIFAPGVAVTVPNGGETFRAGTVETITWTASGIDNVKIEYSIDNGGNWNLIDPSVAGSLGTFDWTVPNVESSQCLIRLSDELDPTIVDVSDANFSIEKPSVTLNFSAGWNVMSAPFNLDDPTASNVFPTKISDIFAYSYGYYIIYNIQPAQGFWVKFPASGSNTVDGSGNSDSTVQVFAGWNIIGAPEYDVLVADITPTNIIISDFYEYGGGYSAVTILQEGKGYWVKCSQPGTLLLPRQSVTKVEPLFTPEEEWITVTVSDAAGNSQQLYVADASGNFELPPLPPNEIFDARFGDDSYLCTEDALSKLRFQSEDYPLTISVSGGNLKLTDGATGTIINRQLLDGESMTITNKHIGSLNINTVEIPADYVLYQNYPNPFNPATTIKFGLPQAGKVEIVVYDQLGQKVETLISEELEAGYHEFEWNAMQYSSGVYFYTINAGQFKSVKKMLLLK